MLNKKTVHKKLMNYVKENSSKGYSGHAIKKTLIEHGYDEIYVDGLLRKHTELKFMKGYVVAVFLLFVISVFAFNFFPIKSMQQKITGFAVSTGATEEGCCTSVCRQTSKNECYGSFTENKKCSEIKECDVGCCIDKEGYCLTNYLYGNCISNEGTHVKKECSDIIFCTNITDKSYSARQHSIKNNRAAGIAIVNPSASYYKSSFNIRYYLYDKANVLYVQAAINGAGSLGDLLTLYDDGSHNDGAKNDNLYGNNWRSSGITDFNGFKKLDIDIIVKYTDGTWQTISKALAIVLLNNNKCLPVYSDWKESNSISIIIASQNYESQQEFEEDSQSFLNSLFSVEKFSSNKDSFNIYRLEQSLSYPDMQGLLTVASSSCPSYSSKKDLVVVLDSKEDYCVLERPNVIRVNPQVLFYKNISSAEISSAFDNLCNYITTPKKLAGDILYFAGPPAIVFHTPENINYSQSAVNLSFTISSSHYPVEYFVFLDDVLIASKKFSGEIKETIPINLANGTNIVLVKAVDKNKNTAFAQLVLNATIIE